MVFFDSFILYSDRGSEGERERERAHCKNELSFGFAREKTYHGSLMFSTWPQVLNRTVEGFISDGTDGHKYAQAYLLILFS